MKLERVGLATPALPVKGDKQTDRANSKDVGSNIDSPREFVEKERTIDPKVLNDSVDLLNKTMESYNTELRFTLHEGSGEYQVKIVDTSNDRVLKEIPAKNVLEMVAYLKHLVGIVVDKYI
ncbi:MAG: flagellar protein FlaG [Peptococcaceae bacterium]|nr:flagellar protein FlaG [Peptococcaceae bacterium]